jgi:hypothetical protein
VFDVSDRGVAAFVERGVPAERLHLGYDERLDRWQERDVDRPVDVVVLGETTERRARTVSTLGEALSRRDVDIRLVRSHAPRRPTCWSATLAGAARHGQGAGPDAWGRPLRLRVAARDRRDLQRLRGRLRGVARLRAARARAPLPERVGTSLPILVDWLLGRPGAPGGDADRAYRFVRDELRLTEGVHALLEPPAKPPRTRGVPRPTRTGRATPEEAVVDSPPPPFLTDAITKQNAVLKKLALELRNVRREVSHVSRLIERPDAPLLVTTRRPPWAPTPWPSRSS